MKVVWCPVRFKRVRCVRDGVCVSVSGVDASASVVALCPVRVRALDLALNY